MVYEVEKRALFKTRTDFDSCEQKVADQGEYVTTYTFKSYLFRKPKYFRIRLTKGKDYAVTTFKSGTYHDPARDELEKNFLLTEMDSFLDNLKQKGFTECAMVETISRKYILDGLSVEFNVIDELGMIVEIEALTEDKSQVPSIEKKILDLMETLDLTELDGHTYQGMMDNMYEKLLKPISEHNFTI